MLQIPVWLNWQPATDFDLRLLAFNPRFPLIVCVGCRFLFYTLTFVNEQSYILPLLFLISIATAPKSAFVTVLKDPAVASPSLTQNNPNSGARTRADLSGGIENNNGQMRLNLTNNSSDSSGEFLGEVIIAIGDDLEKREIGQLTILLAPQETKVMQINGLYTTGNQFSLKIFDRFGSLAFYKIAPIKSVSDTTPAIPVTLRPIPDMKKNSPASPTGAIALPKPGFAQSSEPLPAIAPAIPEVTIKGRLLADPAEADRFVIAFEMSAAQSIRSITDSTLAITLGKFKERKTVSVKQTQVIEFKLPDQFGGERIEYELTSKTGRVIAKGALEIAQLMAEDSVTVTDIRTDRASYEPGDPVQITILLGGKAPNGIRLETQARDGQGGVIFQSQYQSGQSQYQSGQSQYQSGQSQYQSGQSQYQSGQSQYQSGQSQYQSGANNQTNTQNFTMTLPREITAPVSFEFKVYDSETGVLFDSGEREIPIKNAKRRL